MRIVKFICYQIKKYINIAKNNIKWFFFKFFSRKPRILNKEDTIDYVIKNNASITRFGDGEFRLMLKNGDLKFQNGSREISSKLLKAYSCRNRKLLVCTYNFWSKTPMCTKEGQWLKYFVTRYHSKLKHFYDYHYQYGDACISRFYHPFLYNCTDFNMLKKEYIPHLKKIWDERKTIIVEGDKTKLGCGNDLFDNAYEIKRIICPSFNAFEKYNQIYDSIKKHYNKGDLILIALGPTASVLAHELTELEDMQCIDIGHVDIVYIWYLNKSKDKDAIDGKYVNEASLDAKTIKINIDEKKYKSQIVDIIL